MRGPDVSFLSVTRLPPDRIPEQFIPGAPDLAVEILSPTDRWSEVEEKVAEYLAGGARRVWLVEPRERRVIVRYPDRPPKVVGFDDILDGEDVVPGFAPLRSDHHRAFLSEYETLELGGLVLHGETSTYRLAPKLVAAPWWKVL